MENLSNVSLEVKSIFDQLKHLFTHLTVNQSEEIVCKIIPASNPFSLLLSGDKLFMDPGITPRLTLRSMLRLQMPYFH